MVLPGRARSAAGQAAGGPLMHRAGREASSRANPRRGEIRCTRLGRAGRRTLPQTESRLMDAPTSLRRRALWGREPRPCTGGSLDWLTAAEQQVSVALANGDWAPWVRLEQERLPWPVALAALELSAA